MATLLETTVPSLLGVSDAIVIKNKSTATVQGSINIDNTGKVILGGDTGVQVAPTASTTALTVATWDPAIQVFRDSLVVDTTNFRVGINGGAAGIAPTETFHVSGNSVATGDVVTNYSDERLKTNINPIESALDKVNSLRGFDYDSVDANPEIGYEPTRKSDVGLSAQELQKVLPHAVCTAPFDMDGEGGSKSGENYLTIRYERVVPLLVEAIKELSAKLESHNH